MEFYIEEKNRLAVIMGWLVDIVVVITFAGFLVYGFGTQIPVSGHSMMPNLRSDDKVLMNRLAYDIGNPKRFDVAVFVKEDNRINIKRIIGLPGETVQIKNGNIYINDELLDAGGFSAEVSLAGLAENPVHLGEEEYFLLGDNRDSSEDSRFANTGNINRKQLLGKAWLRSYPLIDIDLIK